MKTPGNPAMFRRAFPLAALILVSPAAAEDCPNARTAKLGFVLERQGTVAEVRPATDHFVHVVNSYPGGKKQDVIYYRGFFPISRFDDTARSINIPVSDLRTVFPLAPKARRALTYAPARPDKVGDLISLELTVAGQEQLQLGACSYTVLVVQNRFLNGFFRDAVTIGVTTPGLIWALITAIIFGNRYAGPILAIVLTTFALISVNVSEGIKSLPKDLIDMAKSFDVGVIRRNRHIVLPHLAPFIFTGVRFGFSIAWKVTVLTEVFAASKGIGFEMRTATQLFRLDEFLTWILAFYVLALFLDKVVLETIERRFFAWRGELKS